MSETKAEYYAKHLQRLQKQVITDEQVETIQPTGLPELLARMVTEFQVGLGEQPGELHEHLAISFNHALLAAAQPLLTEYLHKLTSPPQFVVKEAFAGTLEKLPRQNVAEINALLRAKHLDDYRQYADECFMEGNNALPYEAWRIKVGAK